MKKLLLLTPLLLGLTACKSPTGNTLTGAAIALASCQAVRADARLVPWLTLSGDVFLTFASNEPPAPGVLREQLQQVSSYVFTTPEADAIWAVTMVAYESVWSIDMTAERRQQVKDTLAVIGNSLKAGLPCATTQQALSYRPINSFDVSAITDAVTAEFNKIK